MLRSFVEVLALFALPFLLYSAGCLYLGHPLNILHARHRRNLPKLILAGLITAVIGILWMAVIMDHKMGAYQPAVFKDGKLIPELLK